MFHVKHSTVKKASQSLPPAGGKKSEIIFCRGVYLTKNTSQAASVRPQGARAADCIPLFEKGKTLFKQAIASRD